MKSFKVCAYTAFVFTLLAYTVSAQNTRDGIRQRTAAASDGFYYPGEALASHFP